MASSFKGKKKVSFCWLKIHLSCLLVLLLYSTTYTFGSQDELKYQLEEEQPIGTVLGNLIEDAHLGRKYDSMALNQLQFRFLKQLPNGFVIDNATGIIRMGGRIDRETICPFMATTCDVRIDVAIQPAQFFRIVRAVVSILDVNDNAPVFPVSEQVMEVQESAHVGTILVIPNAVDTDSPEYSIQSYRLVSDSDHFKLIGSSRKTDGTFDVKLALAKSLDREAVDKFQLQIVAEDGGVPAKSGSIDISIIVLDVNDNSPVFEHENYNITILENIALQKTILRVRAVDADIGLNGQVYYLLSSPTATQYGHLFGINESTGDLFVKGEINHEESAIYNLVVEARDRGLDSIPVNVPVTVHVVDVNDNAPEITINTLTSVPGVADILEDSFVGAFVAHVTVIDQDSGENSRFECSLNDGTFCFVSAFDSEYQIETASLLDRELRSQYDLILTCKDFGDKPLTSVARIKVRVIDVNDNDPVFSQLTYRGELIENNYIGASVLQVNATDIDSSDNGRIVYSIEGQAADWFQVEQGTGLVKAAISFDRENINQVQFNIIARDKGVPSRSSSALVLVMILDVNDERPMFSHVSYSFVIQENQPIGTEVGAVAAHDSDSSIYGEVTYSIVPAHGSDLFEIDHKSGMITTVKELDRETQSVYYLMAYANDRGVPPLSSSASVTIYVSDENDNPPVFDYPSPYNNTIYVSNRTPKGHVIIRLQTHDIDVSKNAKISYTITEETQIDLFNVDPELGTILVNGDLSDKDGRHYLLEFIAKDDGVPQKIAFARLNIIVNRSVAFPFHSEEESNTNLMIIILLASISGVIMIILIVAIVVLCRQDKSKQSNKYNCRLESLKMEKMESKGIIMRASNSDFSVCSGVAGNGTSMCKKQTSVTLEDEMNKRSGQSWPSSFDPHSLQNPQACSSLLTNSSSANNTYVACPQKPVRMPVFQSSSQALNMVENKDLEVPRRLKTFQGSGEGDGDSMQSGDGSNTDSGHGPSEEGESRPATQTGDAHVAHSEMSPAHRNGGQPAQLSPVGFQVGAVVPCCPDTNYHSSHSYSSQKPVQMSTFNGTAPFRHVDNCWADSASCAELRGASFTDAGSVLQTPIAFNKKSSCIPGSNSNHSVGSVGSFAQRNGHQGGSHVGSLGRKYSTLENHYHQNDFPKSLRKNIAYCGNGNSLALQRLLGQETLAESDCTDQTGQYSCADVSNVLTPLTAENLRRIRTPADYRKFPEDDVATTTSGSYVVDADDLCNEIEELFFKDLRPTKFKLPK